MIKKFCLYFLILCVLNFLSIPVLANNIERNVNYVLDTTFITKLDVNKTSKGQVVQFITNKDYKSDDFIIPKGTIFSGEVKSFKKGRWGYRRAKAIVNIDKMVLPNNEKVYAVKAYTKQHVLKGSAIKNIGKGIVTLPVAIVIGTVGACAIVVETISIVGLVLVAPTSYVVGETMGKLTHGINCEKHEGDSIMLKIEKITNTPIESY